MQAILSCQVALSDYNREMHPPTTEHPCFRRPRHAGFSNTEFSAPRHCCWIPGSAARENPGGGAGVSRTVGVGLSVHARHARAISPSTRANGVGEICFGLVNSFR